MGPRPMGEKLWVDRNRAWHTPRGSEQLPARDSVSWASSEAFVLSLLLPSPSFGSARLQEKAVHSTELSPSIGTAHRFVPTLSGEKK